MSSPLDRLGGHDNLEWKTTGMKQKLISFKQFKKICRQLGTPIDLSLCGKSHNYAGTCHYKMCPVWHSLKSEQLKNII